MPTRRYGRHVVETSRESKVLFPDAGITKGELIDHYEAVADAMLPHVRDRPLVMQRFPDGIGKDGFYHKQVPKHFPDWIDRVSVPTSGGSRQDLVVCNGTATLAYLADQACITPHVWLSRTGALRTPDRMVFDLDPPGDDFAPVRDAARRLHELLDELEVTPFVNTTGSRGVHVSVPLRPEADFDDVRAVARAIADVLAARHDDALTVEQRKDKRRGRLYLDCARNAYAQTAVAPYAVRARPGAPVATPIDWDELADASLDARTYTMKNIRRRLGAKDDPWKGMRRRAVTLSALRRRVESIRDDDG